MVLFCLHFKSMADTGPRQYGSRKLETPERNILHKVALQNFWTPCMWYNLSSFIRCIPFTIHSCLESLVSSGSVLDYYGYNALIGLTINLFYFAIMKASIKNSDFFGKYYWKYFINKCYTKKGFLGIFFRLLCKKILNILIKCILSQMMHAKPRLWWHFLVVYLHIRTTLWTIYKAKYKQSMNKQSKWSMLWPNKNRKRFYSVFFMECI